ncbi:MAG TPA: hypothetical protein VLC93_18725, partial [Myxococcota bacterium]|nr:hypothetical protein [Myxococcota bacterium]
GSAGWVADPLWSAHYAGGGNNQAPVTEDIGDGRGFPGVGDFVDNTQPPYNRPTNTPEVAIVYAGAVYIVSGENGEVLRSRVPGSTTNLAFQLLANRGGPPNIADFDGDGRPEVSFAGTGCMVVVDPDCAANDAAGRVALVSNPTSGCNVAVPTVPGPELCTVAVDGALDEEVGILWQYQTQDESSAVTGTSVFDFQGDGKAEVLYNDECFFRVFEGATSNILYERPNSHRTATEYPIVVDVDGDSNSEIVVVSTGDQSSRYSSGRDRCGGPPLNTALGFAHCSSAGNNRACGNLGGCGWDGDSCEACSAFNASAASCEPAVVAATACSTRADNTAACHVAGGCGMDGGDCRVCSDLDDQTECEAGSGCYWNTAEDPDRCRPTCDAVRDTTNDAGTDVTAECNATPNCMMRGTVCAWRPNGCDWDPGTSTCLQSCSTNYDTSDGDTNSNNECNANGGCRYLSGTNTCETWAYRRTGWEQYPSSACTCADHTQAADCDAARGCRWNGSSCVVVTGAATANNCGSYVTRATCQAHVDDCIWDAYQGASGTCEENPRGQAYICLESTWGVTVFGDTSDLWVKTLPYWYEHPYHITNQDRFGRVVPDWSVCYTGSQCAAQTNPAACEATFVTGSSGPLCEFGDANTDFYNNFRQNVPGFVPLNAPDLQVQAVVASLQNCPPQITVVARIVNKGRAGIRGVDANIGFYRLTTTQTPLQTAQTVTPFALLDLPVDLLPGGSVQVTAVYTVPSTEAPIDL